MPSAWPRDGGLGMSAIRSGRRRWLAAAGGAALFAPWQAWAQKAAPMPRRVVVIGGALAECVYALGMEHVLVAADTTCTYPRPVLALPKVGYLRTLSSEGVLSLRPDLVLMSTDAGPPEALAQLRGSGVRIAAIAEQQDRRGGAAARRAKRRDACAGGFRCRHADHGAAGGGAPRAAGAGTRGLPAGPCGHADDGGRARHRRRCHAALRRRIQRVRR
uniref:Fe/B12 periplasmic-binding domain-containing protein n=1 Tax=blood disease bacterium R229 TaxID=741978 RepID=G2ZKP9_9RALS|nr:exported hypothetical protein [blood disease bacterium R229]